MSNYNGNFIQELQATILNGVYQQLSNTHTNLIAKITKVNSTTINAKPVVNRLVDGKSVELPEFEDIPIINFIGGTSYIQMPLAVGDYCMLFINERCIDNWYYGNDFKKPIIPRMHDYSDAVALVGLHNKNGELTIPDRIKMNGDTLQIGNYEHQGDRIQIGNFTQTGNYTITGNITVNGNITINNGDLVVDGISFKNHVHPQNNGNDTGGGVDTGVAK